MLMTELRHGTEVDKVFQDLFLFIFRPFWSTYGINDTVALSPLQLSFILTGSPTRKLVKMCHTHKLFRGEKDGPKWRGTELYWLTDWLRNSNFCSMNLGLLNEHRRRCHCLDRKLWRGGVGRRRIRRDIPITLYTEWFSRTERIDRCEVVDVSAIVISAPGGLSASQS